MKIIRQMPQSENNFLRFQIGQVEKRPEQLPIYDDLKKVIGYQSGVNSESVFRLIAWGATKAKAEKMLADYEK